MIGCALIAFGTLVVAAGGSLTRLGHYEYLYFAMAAGVSLIFAGVLWTRRPEPSRAPVPTEIPAEAAEHAEPAGQALVGAPVVNGSANGHATLDGQQTPAPSRAEASTAAGDEAIQFIEDVLLPLGDGALMVRCAEWSVPVDDRSALSRDEARIAWRLRCRLSPDARHRFDTHGVAARRQLAVLWAEVLTAPVDAAPDEGDTAPVEARDASTQQLARSVVQSGQ
jgi:hypothetical protein